MALDHVTLYACENTLGLSLGLTQDVWAFASRLQQKVCGKPIQVELITRDGSSITSFSGLEVKADGALSDVEKTDLVILHAIWGDIEPALQHQQPLLNRLAQWHQAGVPIMAATTASFLLAEAGLLDGRICTTHWHKHEEFAQRYPNTDLRRDRYVTATGELYCSAGMNAAMEIIVHLLHRLSGEEVGKAVEKAFLMDFRRGESTDFISVSGQTYHQDAAILIVQQWLEIHYASALSLEILAEKANMSLRTFKRRFKDATGDTPLHYIQNLRVEQGREMLKHSNSSVSEIAWRVGYEDPGHFNRLFKREYGASPAQWRRSLQSTKVPEPAADVLL